MKLMQSILVACALLTAGPGVAHCFSVQYSDEKTSAQLSLPEAWSKPVEEVSTMVRIRTTNLKVQTNGVYDGRTVLGPEFAIGQLWYVVVRCKCGAVSVLESRSLPRGKAGKCRQCYWSSNQKYDCRDKLLYCVWQSMNRRCTLPEVDGYEYYGGRGIRVCSEWRNDFDAFARWALASGYQRGLQIDRKENDGGYGPDNCRWIPNKENCRNRRTSRFLVAFGETKTLAAWLEDSRCKATFSALYKRLEMGWEIETAITTPPKQRAKARA